MKSTDHHDDNLWTFSPLSTLYIVNLYYTAVAIRIKLIQTLGKNKNKIIKYKDRYVTKLLIDN